jgi:hypothetical protein
MLDEVSRWELFLDRLEAAHLLRRVLTVVGIIALGAVTFSAGLFLHPTPVAALPTLVIGTPASMTVNGLTVRDRAAITRAVRDLNHLQHQPDTGIGVMSCPSGAGLEYVVTFSYTNGDRWTVVVQRDSCQLVTAGGFWPRTSADATLLKDLDAIAAAAAR